MGDRDRFRPVLFMAILMGFTAWMGYPASVFSAHDLSRDCYTCHNIEGGQTWSGSHSIWSGKAIGMSPYSRPITCDVCHTDYGDRFKSTSESHHPVDTIGVGAMVNDYDNGVRVFCKDCHNADSVALTPNLTLDLSPRHYTNVTGNDNLDGYPNHDVLFPNNQVVAGDNAHLLSMLLSAGQRTVNGSSVYNKVPSSNPATDYAFCLSCHDGSGNTARAVNVRQDYIDKGHYFKATGGGITAGDRIPCSDCHASHNSVTNARLFEPDNTTFTGTRPSGLTFASPYAPTNAEYRAVCIFCHNDYNAGNTGDGTPKVRNVEPTPRRYGIAGHAASDTQSCKQCHNPHKPEVKCADCHDNDGAKLLPAPIVAWSGGGRASPPGVTAGTYGSHLVALKTDTINTSTDWNAQCNKCHNGHAGPVQVPVPPTSWSDPSGRLTGTNMAVRLGLDNYAVDNGIHLGGTATSGTTEADVCWNCHANATNTVSEWGFNTKTTPTGFPVVLNATPEKFPTLHDGTADRINAGWIWDSSYAAKVLDWTAGYWGNEYDNLIKRRIASVHSVSFDPAGQSSSVAVNINADNTVNHTTPTVENKSYIRCSYCHDVHDLNGATGDTSSGKPWLRGTWVGNPYPPELPPRHAYHVAGAYTTRVTIPIGYFTPRGSSSSRDRGGHFIDQNSGWPTNDPAMNTLALTAGLCTLCHGTNVDTMDFYTGSGLWRAGMVNGHSNSTLGGTRVNAVDLFTGSRGGFGMGMQLRAGESGCSAYPAQQSIGSDGSSYCGMCNCLPETHIQVSGWYGTDKANWYGTGTIGGASGPGTMAHKFTCSKCHSPHAAGLPALLTHNCIDTGLAENAPFPPGNDAASNCHRKKTSADGWHRLAPGQ